MRRTFPSLMACLALVSAGVGCSHVALNPAYQGPQPRPPEFVARYQFPELPELEVASDPPQDRRDYTVRRLTVQLANKFADRLYVDYFEPKQNGIFPLLVVSSILSDPNDTIARLVARYFARHAYACAVVTRGARKLDLNVPLDDLEEWQRAMLRDYAAVKALMAREPKVDSTRMATFGISYGALNNTVLAGTDDSYKAHVIGLAGGPLSEVIARSRELELRMFIRDYCKRHNCTREQFIEHWNKIEADPLKMAPYIDARKVLLGLSRFDLIVPYDNGKKLRNAMGQPETLVLFAGHYTAMPYLAYLLPKSREFLDKKLGVKR